MEQTYTEYILFSFSTGNVGQAFFLDNITGVVRTDSNLDYEVTTSYLLEVQAMDNGSPTLSNITQVLRL